MKTVITTTTTIDAEGKIDTATTTEEIREPADMYIPFQTAYTTRYDGLWAYRVQPENAPFGYAYKVTSQATAHTGFRTREALERWLEERDLVLAESLSTVGSRCAILGEYISASHMLQPGEFLSELGGVVTAVMSNGDYTLAIITEDHEGTRIVNYMNPNIKRRPVFSSPGTSAAYC